MLQYSPDSVLWVYCTIQQWPIKTAGVTAPRVTVWNGEGLITTVNIQQKPSSLSKWRLNNSKFNLSCFNKCFCALSHWTPADWWHVINRITGENKKHYFQCHAGAPKAKDREEVCVKLRGSHHPIPIMTPSLPLWHLGRWKAEIQITLTRADLFIFRLISVHNLSAQMFTGLINTWKKRPKSTNLTWNFKHSCISCLSSYLKELPLVGGLNHGCHWAWVKRPVPSKDHPPCWWNSSHAMHAALYSANPQALW